MIWSARLNTLSQTDGATKMNLHVSHTLADAAKLLQAYA
jgi:hypothetical protein